MLGEMWQFKGRYKILHMTWFAFFLSFVVWFNLAPLATTVKATFGLEPGQIKTVAICNVGMPNRQSLPFGATLAHPALCHRHQELAPPCSCRDVRA